MHVLQLSDGELLTPFGLMDVLDVVEEQMGTDIRQYIEDSFEEGIEEVEDEIEERVNEHSRLVLENLEMKIIQIRNLMNADELDEYAVKEEIEAAWKMINREI